MNDTSQAEGIECTKCRATLEKGEPYYCMRLGMDDEPSHVETRTPLVEDLHELYFCGGCEPGARLMFEGFLRELWETRAGDEPVLGSDLGTEEGRESPTSADMGAPDSDDCEPPTLPGLAPKYAEQ